VDTLTVRVRTAPADRDPPSVRILSTATSAGSADLDARRDQERRRRLSAFLLNKRRRIDPNAPRVGTYTRRNNRIGRPLTQEEVAEALDVSRQWYAALEMGSSIRPSAALLDRIATFFKLREAERLTLFRLAIPEFGISSQGATGILDGLEPPTAYAAAIGSPAEIDAAVDTLARVREQYHRTGNALGAPARSRIIASWDRSRALGVDHTQKTAPFCDCLDDHRAANERLLRAADSIIAHLADEFADTGYVVVIADAEGRMLEIAGDRDAQRFLAKNAFASGGVMSEAALGTNAIGTSLADRRPLQLLGAEHFCDAGVRLTCTAAPICDPATREIVGVLDVTGPSKLVRPYLIGVVMQAALEIEERLALLRGGTRPLEARGSWIG
jgi:transcriptional regulator with XRE-family HTH domain